MHALRSASNVDVHSVPQTFVYAHPTISALSAFLDREIAQVDPIERAVLRIAAYELRHRPDVPYRVVINEAIETTKRFGSEHGHTYVNGVLDHAAAAWRSAEAQAARRP